MIPQNFGDGIKPATIRHGDIKDHYIRFGFASEANGVSSAGSLGHGDHVGLGCNEHLEAGTQNGVIVGNQHTNSGILQHATAVGSGVGTSSREGAGTATVMQVPLPG